MIVASRLRFGETARPAPVRYGVALAATAAALGLSLAVEPLTGGRLPFLLFVVSVVVAAAYGGIGPGLASTVLSVAAAELFLLSPGRGLADHGGMDLVALGIFAAVALLVSWISGRTRLALHELRQRSAELELRQAEAEAAVARLRLLERVARTLTSSLDDERALSDLARLCVESFADYCVTYVLDDGRLRRVGLAHADPDHEPLVRRLLELAPPELGAPGAGAVVASGEAVLARDIPDEMLRASAQDAAHLEVLERLRPRSSMVLPLVARGHTVGAIAFATTDRSGRRYDEHDLTLAREIAAHAALAVDNARLYEQSRREVGQRRATEGALRRRESEVRALVEHAPDLMVRLDRELRYLYVNPAVERQLGRDKREFLGKTLAEARHYAPAELIEVWERTIRQVLATGEPTTAEFSLPTPAGPRFLHTRVVPEHGEDGEIEAVLSLARDITDRRVAEERQAVLVEAGRLATSTLDAATLVESLTDLAARRVADWCVLYVLADSGAEVERVAMAAADPVSHARGEEFLRRHPLQLDRRDLPLVRALLDGDETLLARVDDEPPPGVSADHLAALLRLGVRSAMVVPLPARGRVI
ncbi:MAG TPA: PAS domain-containing protein, partial [Thermoanaerobaculia bacterium]|nr:PAS domain-containing protein [Thermoanaerobaculia bacterium]